MELGEVGALVAIGVEGGVGVEVGFEAMFDFPPVGHAIGIGVGGGVDDLDGVDADLVVVEAVEREGAGRCGEAAEADGVGFPGGAGGGFLGFEEAGFGGGGGGFEVGVGGGVAVEAKEAVCAFVGGADVDDEVVVGVGDAG